MARGAAARDEGLIAAATLTNPALFEFWEKVFFGENDIAVLHGGRSSSKTRDTACQLVRLVDHVGVKMRVLSIDWAPRAACPQSAMHDLANSSRLTRCVL